MSRFCVNLTSGKNNLDKATLGLMAANGALGCERDTMLFLSSDSVVLGTRGGADGLHEEGLPPVKELLDAFLRGGGKLWICPASWQKRDRADADLIEGAEVVGGARLIAFLDDCVCMSF